jgi:ADP-heptose:LPS heptosyltransferase
MASAVRAAPPFPRSILVLKPSSLGDVVHTLPAVAALRRHFPHARIAWMVNPEWAPLLEGNPSIDAVLPFPRSRFRGPLGPLRLLPWARDFATEAASDLVLDFQGLLRSAFIGKLCRIRHFHGLSDAREGARFFYDATARVTPSQHAVDRYLALVASLGVPVPRPLEWPLPAAPLPEGFDADRPFIALHPFSRGQGKSLSLPDLETLCRSLAPLRLVLLGRFESPLPPSLSSLPHLENWLNRTSLPQLVSLLRQASWTISVDSGPMHIAAALSPRLLSIHTWSDPQRVGPYPPEAWIWQNGSLFQRGQPTRTLPAPSPEKAAEWLLAHVS